MAKCARLEDELGELQARLVVVQQQCDRSVAEGKLQAQLSKQAEVPCAGVVSVFVSVWVPCFRRLPAISVQGR